MKTILVLILCFCSIQMFYSQESDGVVSLNIPIRNSLTFNRYAIHPTFSFVREQAKYISLYNKREWVQFDNAPLTYLAGYSGRFAENIGAGVGLFQQNYGVLTTFGGTLNFAYNVRLTSDNNLTFGINSSAYKSGVNTANVITNFDDPSLQNVPENFLMTISPGINYGTTFLDFGVSFNNLVTYNMESSEIIKDDSQRGLQAHMMYTGYMMNSRGFFDQSKFTGLLKSEFMKDDTAISALAMLTVPKGIWAQVGYNTIYGVSGGLGLNITSQIAVEYNIEKGTGAFTNFGNTYSHELTLAFRFKNNKNYYYGNDDEVTGLLIPDQPRRKKSRVANAKPTPSKSGNNEDKDSDKLLAEQRARNLAEAKAAKEAEEKAKLIAEQKAREEAEALAKKEENDRLLAEEKARQEAEVQARILAEQKAKEEAEIRAKQLEEQKAREQAEAEAKREAEAQARLEAEQKAKELAEAEAKALEEQTAQTPEEDEDPITNPKDELGKSMYAITQQAESDKTNQTKLLEAYDAIIQTKDKDLKDLKEENDLSEQGIAVGPKPFKSITEENNRLRTIESELDNVINDRNSKIQQLKKLYEDNFEADTITNDPVYLFYQKTLKRLESEQLQAIEIKSNLETRLADIKVATEFERRRRIKRAAFDNQQERYNQDRATLANIKRITQVSNVPVNEEEFDFGEEQSSNIQILKNVQNVDNGYYLVVAVHTSVEKRNDFVTKMVASGRQDVDFFYDVNTSKYYIYHSKFNGIQEANAALQAKDNKPYNKKMSLVKIEN